MKIKYSKAFTLVELLIVATIIAMLSVVVIVNLNKARIKSRDTQRKADLTKLAGALDTYKMDAKSYIVLGSMTEITSTNFAPLTTGGYLPTIPVDPIDDATYFYEYQGNATRYKLRARSENITSTTDTNASTKAGDFYNSCASCDIRYYQISTDATALAW